ncbi:hypothetical protein APHAL10511_005808 [Amanita phalloides]|nr:hypothetical protein APHAL10511_005808 [Amanita phalloides]
MAGNAFPLDTAQIVALFVESVLYGFALGMLLITFFHCLRVLLWEDGRLRTWRRLHWKMLIGSLLMFTFASLDVAFGLRHNLEAFVYFQGGPIKDFERLSNWINVMKMVNYVGQTFVGDAILLYRCWVIYNRNWLVVFLPILMWLGETGELVCKLPLDKLTDKAAGCGVMAACSEATLRADNSGRLNTASLSPWITSLLSLTLATNLSTTSLMVYRIWKIKRALTHKSVMTVSMPLTSVIRVLIESGTFYTASIAILFVLYMLSSNAELPVSDAVVQIIGITFNMIITRVNRGDTTQSSTTKVSEAGSRHIVPLHMINVQTTITRYQDPDQVSDFGMSPTSAKRVSF